VSVLEDRGMIVLEWAGRGWLVSPRDCCIVMSRVGFLKSKSLYIESGMLVRTEVGRELVKELVPERYIQGFSWECLY